jgi:transposase
VLGIDLGKTVFHLVGVDSTARVVSGVGPVTATALIAAVGNESTFKKGRNLSAWMGIVPGEYSTGGKQKLLGISKRGNKYLRRLFVQGPRSVLQQRHKQAPGLSSWLAQERTLSRSRFRGDHLKSLF